MAPKKSSVFAVAGVVVVVAIVAGIVATADGKLISPPIAPSSGPKSNSAQGPQGFASSMPAEDIQNLAAADGSNRSAGPDNASGPRLITMLPSHSQIGAGWAIQPVIAPPPHSKNASDYDGSRLSPGKLIDFNTNPNTQSVVEGGYFKSAKSGNTLVSVFLAAFNSTQGPMDAYTSSTQYSNEGYQRFDTSSIPDSVCFGAFYGNLEPGERSEIYCHIGNAYFEVSADSDAAQDTRATALMFAKSTADNLGAALIGN